MIAQHIVSAIYDILAALGPKAQNVITKVKQYLEILLAECENFTGKSVEVPSTGNFALDLALSVLPTLIKGFIDRGPIAKLLTEIVQWLDIILQHPDMAGNTLQAAPAKNNATKQPATPASTNAKPLQAVVLQSQPNGGTAKVGDVEVPVANHHLL